LTYTAQPQWRKVKSRADGCPFFSQVRELPGAEKRKRADFVVDTSHGLDPVRSRIRDILDQVV
jgi:hypothetical protein